MFSYEMISMLRILSHLVIVFSLILTVMGVLRFVIDRDYNYIIPALLTLFASLVCIILVNRIDSASVKQPTKDMIESGYEIYLDGEKVLNPEAVILDNYKIIEQDDDKKILYIETKEKKLEEDW